MRMSELYAQEERIRLNQKRGEYCGAYLLLKYMDQRVQIHLSRQCRERVEVLKPLFLYSKNAEARLKSRAPESAANNAIGVCLCG